ncbi:MAG: hypothetical protein AAF514_00105 [Verrucomicrobiota bacterium]
MKSRMISSASILLWAGLVLGISFIEAPLKFRAPDVTTEIGLGIGRLVFTAMNRMEWVFAIPILVCLALDRASLRTWIFVGVPFVFLILQTFVLLPPLHDRTDRLLAGETLEPSNRHIFYIVTEAIKFLALLVAGFHLLKGLALHQPPSFQRSKNS